MGSNTKDSEDSPITALQMKCLRSSETGEITFFQVENFARTNAASHLRVKEWIGFMQPELGHLGRAFQAEVLSAGSNT